jgi:hypothetical protein
MRPPSRSDLQRHRMNKRKINPQGSNAVRKKVGYFLSRQRRLRASLRNRTKKETSANQHEYATNSPLSMTSQTVAGDQSQLAAPENYQRKLRIQDVSRETISSDFSTCLQARNEALQSSIWGIASLEHTSFTAQEVDALDRVRMYIGVSVK